jgi:signal peptidase I
MVSAVADPGTESAAASTGGGGSSGTVAQSGARSGARSIVEWVVIIVAALLVAFLVKSFLIQAFYIPSGSMEPTLKPGDRVLVNKISYDLHSIHRGDIVVFAKPASDYDPGVSDLVKRVIGLPGETIASGPNGQILIDGKPIPQPWLTASAKVSPGPAIVASDCGTPNATTCVIPPLDHGSGTTAPGPRLRESPGPGDVPPRVPPNQVTGPNFPPRRSQYVPGITLARTDQGQGGISR